MPKNNTINNKYEKLIAKLVTKIDQLETELSYLNRILVKAGFSEGIKTLKATVEEALEDGSISPVETSKEGYLEI